MIAIASDVSHLVDLARDNSVDGRSALAVAISSLVDDDARQLTPHELALMNDILKKLIQDVARPIRKSLATKLAASHNAPPEIVEILANDDFDIASPILLKSDLLSDSSLIEIVRHRSQAHRLAIAMRRGVSIAVCDSLVATGAPDVIRTLLQNHGAEISNSTMAYLVEQSRTVDEFQEPLLRRNDLDPELAKRMYTWVSAALRQFIVENFPVDEIGVDLAVGKAAEEAIESAVWQAEEETASHNLAVELSKKQQLTPALLLQTLRQGEVALFEALLGQLTQLKASSIRKLIYDEGAEGLVIVSRASHIDRTSFTSIFLLLQRIHPQELAKDAYAMKHALDLFDRLKTETAAKVIERWKLNPDFLRSIKRLEQTRR
ncbi:MAG: DUF2336 domain-containing protein [Rhodospirillaceae bacterium]|nr:MAG: DUF2336 domain-containing protein [Rhodospirillaceae bacterium]